MVRKQRGKRRASAPEQHPAAISPHHPSPHSRDLHPHRVGHLLYLITFLLIILVLVVFFSFPLSYTSPPPSSPTSYSLTIDSVSCQWQNDQFVVCATASWDGEDVLFAKGYIPGSESLDISAPQTTSPFTYCQPVGTEEGYRVARALLYASSGLVRDIGQGTECLGKALAPSPSSGSKKTIVSIASTGFRVAPTQSSARRAEGIFTKKFPGTLQSCTYTGRWVTDNDQYGRQRNVCDGATGMFEGYADAQGQYVINDPDLFRWAGLSQAALNPSPQRYDGYGFWMESCDAEYYRSTHTPRFGAQGTLQGFGTDTLVFSWTYFDENTRPAVDFFFDLSCVLKPA